MSEDMYDNQIKASCNIVPVHKEVIQIIKRDYQTRLKEGASEEELAWWRQKIADLEDPNSYGIIIDEDYMRNL